MPFRAGNSWLRFPWGWGEDRSKKIIWNRFPNPKLHLRHRGLPNTTPLPLPPCAVYTVQAGPGPNQNPQALYFALGATRLAGLATAENTSGLERPSLSGGAPLLESQGRGYPSS